MNTINHLLAKDLYILNQSVTDHFQDSPKDLAYVFIRFAGQNLKELKQQLVDLGWMPERLRVRRTDANVAEVQYLPEEWNLGEILSADEEPCGRCGAIEWEGIEDIGFDEEEPPTQMVSYIRCCACGHVVGLSVEDILDMGYDDANVSFQL